MTKNRESRKLELETKKSKLRGLLRDDKISDDEYKTDLVSLEKEYNDTKGESQNLDWYSEMMCITEILPEIISTLQNGTYEAKRTLLTQICSNLVWNEEILSIYNKKSIEVLVNGIKLIKSKYPWFEPKNYVVNKGQKEKNSSENEIFSNLLRTWDDVRKELKSI